MRGKHYLIVAAMLPTLAYAAQSAAPKVAAPAVRAPAATVAPARAAPAATPTPALPAAKGVPAAFAALRPGLYHLKMVDSSEPERDICVADARALMQIRHGAAACDSLVVADEPRAATVNYTCPAAGWGRSTLKLAAPDEARIDSQGIADKAPFAFVAEAHRTGDCAAATSAAAAK